MSSAHASHRIQAAQSARFARLLALSLFASGAIGGVGLAAGADPLSAAVALGPVFLWALGRPEKDCGVLVLIISAAQSGAALYLGALTGAASAFAVWTVAPALAAYAAGRAGLTPIIPALAALTTLFMLQTGSSEALGFAQACALITFCVYALWAATVVEASLKDAARRADREVRRKQMLLENLEQAAFRLDSEGRIREACGGVRQLFGKSIDEIIGVRVEDLHADADSAEIARAFQQAKYHDAPVSALAKPRASMDVAAAVRIKFRVAPRRARTDPFELLATISAASEALAEKETARRALLQAESAQRDRDNFMSNMSHELRTPLNALVGFSEILAFSEDGGVNAELAQDYAMHIYESGYGLAELVENLFDLSDEGQPDPESQAAAPVARTARQCVSALKGRIQSRGATLNLNIPEDLPRARLETRALRQIILNAASQALRTIRPGGRLDVAAMREGQSMRVTFRDDGAGLPEGAARKLMGPLEFDGAPYVASDALKGLWFTAIRRLAERAGGSASISGAPGRGTEVAVTLPIALADIDDAPGLPAPKRRVSGDGGSMGLDIPEPPENL